MIFAAYALYALLTALALLRGWRMGTAVQASLPLVTTVTTMVLLPPVLAASFTVDLGNHSDLRSAAILLTFSAGVLTYAAGFADLSKPASNVGLLLRATGWSLVAGVTLIPSILALLAPAAGLLAFTVVRAGRGIPVTPAAGGPRRG